jgi:hypothetical protein
MAAATKSPRPEQRVDVSAPDAAVEFPQPHDIEAAETFAFISPHLPRQRCRLLKIGGGSHTCARQLAESGHEFHVLDPTGQSVLPKDAVSLSVNFVHPEALELESFAYDAAILTNGLSHFHDLDTLIELSAKSLVSSGLLFIDEPDHSNLAAGTSDWYRMTLRELNNRGYIDLSPDNDLERSVLAGKTIAQHIRQRGLATHSAADHFASLHGRFSILSETKLPYLYRYFAEVVPSGEPGARLVRSFLAQESAAIEQGSLEPVGHRIIAIKK